MSDAALTIFDRFRQWPRALQWAALAAIGLALFFIWSDYLSAWTDRVAKRADALQSQIADVRQASDLVSKFNAPDMKQVVESMGQVDEPKDATKGADLLQDEINAVLKKHTVSNQGYDQRSRGRLPAGTLGSVTTRRLDRLTGDLKFTATPEEATAIIAELESSAIVVSIDTVRMVKDANRKVKVNLSLEAWVESSDTGRSGR
jgi:hypothetical protein